MKYAVHLYPTVRVKVTGIEANSIAEAVQKAEASVDLHNVLDNSRPGASNVECIEWDEGANNFVLVDPLDDKGEVIYGQTQWLDGMTGEPLIDGKTGVERKAAASDAAALFMQELLASVETLCGIAEQHGASTLADLMYLQQAILKGSFIEHYPNESKVLDLARSLPSGERWVNFIKVEQIAPSPVFEVALRMENGIDFTWKGEADDRDHAEGQAVAEASTKTGQQVHHIVSVITQ